MAYSTYSQVETALGMEAGTLTTAQQTLVTAKIVLVDSLIDLFTGGKLAGTETGLADISANAAGALFEDPSLYWSKEWRDLLWESCKTILTVKDYKRLAYIGDMVHPFAEDED